MSAMEKRQEAVERTVTNNSQYLRNRQLEIDTSKHEPRNGPTLKGQVAAMLSLTGTAVSADELAKCHLLGSKSKTVIMEFYDRELRDSILLARKHLKNVDDAEYGKVYITESLCDQYKKLDFACRKLKKAGKVESTWFFNGRLWIQKSADAQKKQICHLQDLYALFGEKTIDDLYKN
jgi:hypothetical protein